MSIRQQLLVVGGVWLCIVGCLFALAVTTGNFRVDNTNHVKWFGVYDRDVAIAAQYNTGLETIVLFEGLSLLILPLFLLIVRKLAGQSKELLVAPWLVVSFAMVFAAVVWPFGFGARGRSLDFLNSSELPDLLLFQIPVALGLAGALYLLRRSVSTGDTASPDPSSAKPNS